MALIYQVTASPGSTSGSTGSFLQQWTNLSDETIREVNLVMRKSAHFILFGILGGLLLIALRRFRYAPFWAWALATAWGALDEWHQSQVPSRSPLFTDVLIDSAGAATVILLIWLSFRRRGRKHSS